MKRKTIMRSTLAASVSLLIAGAAFAADGFNYRIYSPGVGAPGPVNYPLSCLSILQQNPVAATGSYQLRINNTVVTAYCDMAGDGGGWTLVAKQGTTAPWMDQTGEVAVSGLANVVAAPGELSKLSDSAINSMARSAIRIHSYTPTGVNKDYRSYLPGSCPISFTGIADVAGPCGVAYTTAELTTPIARMQTGSISIITPEIRGMGLNFVLLGTASYPYPRLSGLNQPAHTHIWVR